MIDTVDFSLRAIQLPNSPNVVILYPETPLTRFQYDALTEEISRLRNSGDIQFPILFWNHELNAETMTLQEIVDLRDQLNAIIGEWKDEPADY